MSHLSKLDLKIIDQILSEGNIWWGADEIIERLASAGFLIVRDDGRDIRSCKQGAADG